MGPGGPPRGTRARNWVDAIFKEHDDLYDDAGLNWFNRWVTPTGWKKGTRADALLARRLSPQGLGFQAVRAVGTRLGRKVVAPILRATVLPVGLGIEAIAHDLYSRLPWWLK